jgi:hypothetical protein
MLRYRYDALRAFAVMVVSPPATDADIDEYVACVKTLDAAAANREGAALVLVLQAGYPLPNAEARKRAVDARKDMKSRPVVAVVTTNPLLRAALAAARWISPPRFEQGIVTSFEDAVTFIESNRGPTLGLLHRMYQEACAK